MEAPINKEYKIAGPIIIRYTGLFNFRGLYQFIYSWLQKRRLETFTEKRFKEAGPDVDIEWIAEKKTTPYLKDKYEVTWKLVGNRRVEIKEGNKKVTMNKSNLRIEITVYSIVDYNEIFGKSSFGKFLGAIYFKLFKREWMFKHAGKLEGELHSLEREIRKFLNID